MLKKPGDYSDYLHNTHYMVSTPRTKQMTTASGHTSVAFYESLGWWLHYSKLCSKGIIN